MARGEVEGKVGAKAAATLWDMEHGRMQVYISLPFLRIKFGLCAVTLPLCRSVLMSMHVWCNEHRHIKLRHLQSRICTLVRTGVSTSLNPPVDVGYTCTLERSEGFALLGSQTAD
jgi:hypothetical protein